MKLIRATWWSADHHSRLTCQWAFSLPAAMWCLLIGSRRQFREAQASSRPRHPWFHPIYSRRGVRIRASNTSHLTLHSPLEFSLELRVVLKSLGVEILRKERRSWRSSPNCTSTRVRESRGKCRVCQHSSSPVPRRMLINHSKYS